MHVRKELKASRIQVFSKANSVSKTKLRINK